MATCNINSLLDSGKCFACLTAGEMDIIELQLLCEILSAGGVGGGAASGSAATFQNVLITAPASIISVKDDFNAGTAGSGTLGEMAWINDLIGAGGGVSAVSGTFGYPQWGVARLFSTQNAAGGTLELSLSGQASINNSMTRAWDMTWILNFNANTAMQVYFGLGDGTTALQTNGVGFRFDTTLGDTAWFIYTMNTSVQTAVTTGVPVDATTTFHNFRMVGDGLGTVTFYIDGVVVGTRSTGGPAGTTFLRPAGQLLSVGVVTRHFNIDFFSYQERLTR